MKQALFYRSRVSGKYLRLAVLLAGLAASLSGWHLGMARAASLDMPPATKDADALGVAYDCLAALARSSRGDKALLIRAKASGDELLTKVTLDGNKRTGWPYLQKMTEESRKCGQAGALDAFGDATCNPPETPYMLQTGYAVTCLAQLSIVTGEDKYIQAARKAVSDSWSLGSTVTGCKDCFYYWYSYHANDLNRYVRNTNVVMGLGLAWMFAATGETVYRDRALAIARAEHHEILSGNAGYFGVDDPKYRANPKFEAQRIENHVPHQAKGLKDISKLTGNVQALNDAKSEMNSFLNCRNDRCRPDNCKAWAAPPACRATATIAPCILADQGDPYRSQCQAVLKELSRLNAFQIFMLESASDKNGLIGK